MRRWSLRLLLVLVIAAASIQLVPVYPDPGNPPVSAEPSWDTFRTRELFYRTCGDCHSHRTRWPWYSRVAPVSWLVRKDVIDGRGELNVSLWGQGHQESGEAAGLAEKGEMPPWFYLPLHADARLGEAEKQQLVQGLAATFGRGEH
jgi:hypothetical protein